jgi:hypothetical protein
MPAETLVAYGPFWATVGLVIGHHLYCESHGFTADRARGFLDRQAVEHERSVRAQRTPEPIHA